MLSVLNQIVAILAVLATAVVYGTDSGAGKMTGPTRPCWSLPD